MIRPLLSLFAPKAGADIFDPAIGAAVPTFRLVKDVLPKVARLPDYLDLDNNVRKVNNGYVLPILNQSFVGLCTSAAWSTARRISKASTGLPWTNPCVEWMYGMARIRLGSPNNNPPGTSVGDIATIAQTVGVLESAQYPGWDLRFYNPKTAQSWEKVGPPPTLLPFVKTKAESLLAFSEADVQSALAAGLAVAFSCRWYFTQTDNNGVIISTSINPPQGHAMVIQGFWRDSTGEYYLIRNSMGSSIFSGKQHPKFPLRGTGLCRAEEMRATVFDKGTMFVPTASITYP